jgi:hypothetical protein
MFEGAHGGPQLLLLVVVGAGVTLCARMGVATATMAARFNFMVRLSDLNPEAWVLTR